MTAYWCERAWLDDAGVVDGVLVEIDGSHIVRVDRVATCPDAATRLTGLTIPGFANCHSHAFHRALRGRTQRERGSFWTWRDTMYEVAERLDPETLLRARQGGVRRDGADRDHRGRGVPLRPSRA